MARLPGLQLYTLQYTTLACTLIQFGWIQALRSKCGRGWIPAGFGTATFQAVFRMHRVGAPFPPEGKSIPQRSRSRR
jgi:hypothetical protein